MQITGSLQRLSLTWVGDYFWQRETNCGTIDGPVGGLYIYMMVPGDYLQWYTICGDYWGGDQPQEKFQNKKSQ